MARSNKRKKQMKLDIKINSEMMDLLLAYALSDNGMITSRSLINLKNLLDMIDFNDDDYENTVKYEILTNLLDLLVNENIRKIQILTDNCVAKIPEQKEYIESMFEFFSDERQLSDSDIEYINKFVEERLQFAYLFKYKERINNALQNLESNGNMLEVNSQFEDIILPLYKDFQNAKAIQKEAAGDFTIGNKNFKPALQRAIKKANSPTNHIKTGIQALNTMLDGGWEGGRTYVVLALPKGGKSTLLLNTGITACKYNKFKPKDPYKKPVVLYITQENSPNETIERIYAYATGETLKGVDLDEAYKLIQDEICSEENNVGFEIKYRSHKSINTDDVNRMIDDLALEGKEVVLVIHDYLKRIRSSQNIPDIRLELGEIINEFCTISKERDIPIITASQLNREAYRIIEQNEGANRTNLTKMLNKSHVGESALIIENADYAFIVNPEVDKLTDEKYTAFKLVASRVKQPSLSYFVQPMENGMRYKEDFNLPKPLYREEIGGVDNNNFDPNQFRNKRNLEKPVSTNKLKKHIDNIEDGEIDV